MIKAFNIKDWQTKHLHECNGNCGCGCKTTIKEASDIMDNDEQKKLERIVDPLEQLYNGIVAGYNLDNKGQKELKKEIFKYIDKQL